MASTIAALTSGAGGISMTGDASGILNLNSNATTVVAVTSAGVAVTGTLSASGVTTLANGAILGTPASGVLTNCTGVSKAALPAGSVLQVKNYQFGTLATTSATIPFDNTIPQITEGGQILTLAITPTSATSKLVIHSSWWWFNNTSAFNTAALFQDATANSLAAVSSYFVGTYGQGGSLDYFMTSGTTASTTFTIRMGSSGGTMSINGYGGGQIFGGAGACSITITEIAA